MPVARRTRTRRPGAVHLELIVSLLVFMIGLLAIVEFGLVTTNLQQVALASRQGAEVAANTANLWSAGNVPTEVVIEQLVDATPIAELRNRPEMRFMPAETVENWVRAK